MATFESRVRELVQEELRDVYRLFQDHAELEVQQVPLRGGVDPMILNRLEEMKSEVKHIENILTDQPIDEQEDETDEQDKDPEKKKRAWKRMRRMLEWILDQLDPSDDVKSNLMKALPPALEVAKVPVDLIRTLFTTVVGATNHARTRNELWTVCNKLQSELQIISGNVARIKPQTYEDLASLLQQQTQILTEQQTQSIEEVVKAMESSKEEVINSIGSIDRNITVVGRDLTFEIESLYSRMIAGGGLFRPTF